MDYIVYATNHGYRRPRFHLSSTTTTSTSLARRRDRKRGLTPFSSPEKVGDYIPDLLAFGKIVVDTKVIEQITDREIGQMMNYLKITGCRLGYILNFKKPNLEWKRVVK